MVKGRPLSKEEIVAIRNVVDKAGLINVIAYTKLSENTVRRALLAESLSPETRDRLKGVLRADVKVIKAIGGKRKYTYSRMVQRKLANWEKAVIEHIKTLRMSGLSTKKVADRFGISPSVIHYIVKEENITESMAKKIKGILDNENVSIVEVMPKKRKYTRHQKKNLWIRICDWFYNILTGGK